MSQKEPAHGTWLRRSGIILVIAFMLLSLGFVYTKFSYNNVKYTLFVENDSQCESYYSTKGQTFEKKCHWYFVNYTPSAWERMWYDNIQELQNKVCSTLTTGHNVNKTVLLMKRLLELQKTGKSQQHDEQYVNDEVFSRMFYRQRCFNSRTKMYSDGIEVFQLIEPLVGLLRDPLTICSRLDASQVPPSLYNGAVLLSKRHILLSISAPFYISSPSSQQQTISTKDFITTYSKTNVHPWMYDRSQMNASLTIGNRSNGKLILFDLGSSEFGKNVDIDTTSTRWFYEYYKRLDLNFDRIIAFEARVLNATVAWEQLPEDVFPVYTLINTGCTVTGKFNPWFTLQKIAKPEDHVIVKLDIDTFDVERALVDQIANDSAIHSLIDELFFEHHVLVDEMRAFWRPPPDPLSQSYILFTKLRQLGIRMHGWP
ncbi:unnamed protein product [Adineta ricciae]|uniref:Uncharacterized protein n=3 Tax=Adineta ricciae TaxID=249248 RepID=A0A815G2R7_ADIRI|nr:unnamed protein product [Adineta ricciae]